jgi:hypothetical protein
MGASDRDEWLRAAWRTMIATTLDVRRLVFVEECGTYTSLAPLYAWASSHTGPSTPILKVYP